MADPIRSVYQNDVEYAAERLLCTGEQFEYAHAGRLSFAALFSSSGDGSFDPSSGTLVDSEGNAVVSRQLHLDPELRYPHVRASGSEREPVVSVPEHLFDSTYRSQNRTVRPTAFLLPDGLLVVAQQTLMIPHRYVVTDVACYAYDTSEQVWSYVRSAEALERIERALEDGS